MAARMLLSTTTYYSTCLFRQKPTQEEGATTVQKHLSLRKKERKGGKKVFHPSCTYKETSDGASKHSADAFVVALLSPT